MFYFTENSKKAVTSVMRTFGTYGTNIRQERNFVCYRENVLIAQHSTPLTLAGLLPASKREVGSYYRCASKYGN